MKLSVLQWNVWYKEDLSNIAVFLKELQPDVICLQELTIDSHDQVIQHGPNFIAEELGYSSYYQELPIETTDSSNLKLANGIFSRFPVTASRFAWINEPKSAGGYSDEYRAYVEVSLEIDGKPLHVGTTHSSYTHKFESTAQKATEIGLLVDELQRHKENFVFTGDLNATPESKAIGDIGSVLKNAGPEAEQKTWTTKPFSYNEFDVSTLDWRLDYVFATPDMHVLESKILTTEFSDHLPILTTFEI